VLNYVYQIGIKQITKISTVSEIFNKCNISKQMFRDLDNLARLYLTISITAVTAKRTFSTLDRL